MCFKHWFQIGFEFVYTVKNAYSGFKSLFPKVSFGDAVCLLLLRGVASEESPNGTDVAVTSLDHFLSSALLLLRKAHAQTVSGK